MIALAAREGVIALLGRGRRARSPQRGELLPALTMFRVMPAIRSAGRRVVHHAVGAIGGKFRFCTTLLLAAQRCW